MNRQEMDRRFMKFMKSPAMQEADREIDRLHNQLAAARGRRERLIEAEVEKLGLIGRRVKYGKDIYIVSRARDTLSTLDVFGRKLKKDGTPGEREVRIWSPWEFTDE